MARLHFVVLFAACIAVMDAVASEPLRFNRDIRSILADKCFACHGPDAKTVEGDLRLDLRENAIESAAIVPGNPDESKLVQRVFSTDADELMPPTKAHKPLTDRERQRLREWIDEGAEYEAHWAYTPVLGNETNDPTKSTAIDRFISRRLVAAGVEPTPPADKVTLIRRLCLDLTGLTPTLAEVDAFVNDNSADSYEKLVDRLLDSSRYGERMAIYWLDLVRYADTVGYHGDQNVSQSPFRDYVIDAFNSNMPYDRFVREQLAGDLLPDATLMQRVASGYNRLNQTTEEGGSQAKEYLAIYFADRVRNVSQVFMGATLGCAQCHDHKYDPYTTRDFYSLGAFFADLEELGVYSGRNREPMIRVPSEQQQLQLDAAEQSHAELNCKYLSLREKLLAAQAGWEAAMIARMAEVRETESEWVDDVGLAEGSEVNGMALTQFGGLAYWDKADWTTSEIQQEVADALLIDPAQRNETQSEAVQDYFLANAVALEELKQQLADSDLERKRIEESAPLTVVSKSVPPREIRVLPRGDWMNDSGEIVGPAIPAFLGKLETEGRRPTRLDLANWLCTPDNPLTSRTLVNRLWSLLFGRGICSSVDDLGGQGSFPSYPDLLDWLAADFVESGWDIKHMLRTIVNSDAYKRSSKPTPTLRSNDPYNDLFARQGRFRIDAEMVRDAALLVSGLLAEKVGGPSVHPYQPVDYYAQLNFPKRTYVADTGFNQYRRGVYTHWQRTFLHPMLKAFDAPSREECTASRSRSNTPLQALALLNDPTFVEAARVFAARIMTEGGSGTQQRIEWAYRSVVSRNPEAAIAGELEQLFNQHRAHYREHVQESQKLIREGTAPVNESLDAAELAAWTSVARVILNLHESIMRY